MNIRLIKVHTALLLLLTGLALSGCAHKQRAIDDSFAFSDAIEIVAAPDRANMSQKERFAYDYRTAAVARMRDESVSLPSDDLIARAKTAIGTPYVRGGTSKAGFDCSGFVQWAYKHVGVTLPRTAREQSVLGTAIDNDEMEAGDIVAFKHPRRGYHTGIYIGDGKFIHSPRRGKRVEITSLNDPYFSSTFLGARRVGVSEADAQTAERLVASYESRTRRKADSSASLSSRSDRKKASASYSSSKKKGHRTAVSSRSSSKDKHSRVSEKRQREKKVTASNKRNTSEQKASRSKKKENSRLVSQRSSTKQTPATRKNRSTSQKKSRR